MRIAHMRSFIFVPLLVACGSGPSSSDAGNTAPEGGTPDGSAKDTGVSSCTIPTGAAALLPWLQAKSYASWKAESKVHMSAGPHGGNVRTYLSPEIEPSFGGMSEHARCSALVKELYGNGTSQITGWAVSVKVDSSSQSGQGWYWYELISMGGNPVADGKGVTLCTSCHSGGRDYVLSPTPLQ